LEDSLLKRCLNLENDLKRSRLAENEMQNKVLVLE
jgi:hypothetical protein